MSNARAATANASPVVVGCRAVFEGYDENTGAQRFKWNETEHDPTLVLEMHRG
jgi:hypothetical protein